jgi:hypothetical protein
VTEEKTTAAVSQFAGAPPVEQLKHMLDSHRTATDKSSKEQSTDRDYFDGPGQLNSPVRRVLKARGQPAIYTNRIRPAIDGVLGVLDASETSPRAYPRNPNPRQENAADVATKALRYIADKNQFKAVRLDCAEEHQIEGVCAALVEVDGDLDAVVTQIPWKDFFYDPRSRKADFSDARFMGAAKWMYADDVQRLYPKRYAEMGDPIDGAMATDFIREDKPEGALGWVDRKDRRLMVVEVYYRVGPDWFRCVFCASGIFEFSPSPYVDDKGQTICPIEAQSCYIDRDYQRYGRVRDMRPIQDEINARRSRLLHLANSRQIQERETGAAIVDAETARMEAAKADGVIPSGWQMVPTADLAAGQQLLLAESKSEIERMGPTPAVLGRQGSAAQSGRAKQVLEQAGLTELGRCLSRFEDWEQRCYRQMWLRAKQFKTEPWWVRVTDDVRAPQFIQINAPDGQFDAEGNPVPTNRIAEMDMDIIIDTVPNQASLAQEVWQDMVELLKLYPPDDPRFEIAVEMSPIADKARIIERVKAFKAERAKEAEGGGQAQQAMMAKQIEELDAKIADIKASALQKASVADKNTQETNAKQAETFAALGPIAASFGIMPDEAGVANMQARVGGAMPPAVMAPVEPSSAPIPG